MRCWCSWWFNICLKEGCTWNTRDGWNSLKPTALFSSIVFIESPFLTQQVSASPLATVWSLQHTSKFAPQGGQAYRSAPRMTFLLQNRLFPVYRFARDCPGFGWWRWKSPFCRWHPTGSTYGSQLLRPSVYDGTALGTPLSNKSKLLEWSRRRTYSKQRFPALSHRVL